MVWLTFGDKIMDWVGISFSDKLETVKVPVSKSLPEPSERSNSKKIDFQEVAKTVPPNFGLMGAHRQNIVICDRSNES
jgi:hypothetical protein